MTDRGLCRIGMDHQYICTSLIPRQNKCVQESCFYFRTNENLEEKILEIMERVLEYCSRVVYLEA
jgi:hypothetical protein